MIKSIFTILFLISLFTTAQENYNNKSMVVSIADLKNNTYENDSTANAFFIYEKGFSRIENNNNFNLFTDYEAKIKILNKQGFDKATVKVQLYKNKSGKETFRKLVAYTYNLENGKIAKTKIEDQNIFKEEYDDNFTLIKFTFPKVKPGSIITYKYQTESPFIYKFKDWEFQSDIPKIYSEFTAKIPGNYIYNAKLVGYLKLDHKEEKLIRQCIEVPGRGSADCAQIIYTMKNIPAFKKEKYMTAKENYFSRIDYELKEVKYFDGTKKKYTETWKNVDIRLKKEPTIGLQLKKINSTKDILPESIQNMPSDLSKAKAIYHYVTEHYKWNGKYELFKRNNKDSEIKNIIEKKTGNIAATNILLHNILKQQGFAVNPVLLSTRNNGYPTKLYPVISDFNYLITRLSINDENFLLDASENVLAFGEVPFRCLNHHGRLLDFDKGSSWIEITPRQRSSYFFKESVKLNTELELEGNAKHGFSGYHGYFKRKKIDGTNPENYSNNIKNLNTEININNSSVNNLKDLEKAFEEEFDFTKSAEHIDNLIYIKPFLRPFFKENPLKLDKRTYPVDFGYKDTYTYHVSIKIPEEYEFIDIPKEQLYIIPNKSGKISLNFQHTKNQLIIIHRVIFNSSYYPPEYYSILKEFFNLIVQIENDMLITVKKVS